MSCYSCVLPGHSTYNKHSIEYVGHLRDVKQIAMLWATSTSEFVLYSVVQASHINCSFTEFAKLGERCSQLMMHSSILLLNWGYRSWRVWFSIWKWCRYQLNGKMQKLRSFPCCFDSSTLQLFSLNNLVFTISLSLFGTLGGVRIHEFCTWYAVHIGLTKSVRFFAHAGLSNLSSSRLLSCPLNTSQLSLISCFRFTPKFPSLPVNDISAYAAYAHHFVSPRCCCIQATGHGQASAWLLCLRWIRSWWLYDWCIRLKCVVVFCIIDILFVKAPNWLNWQSRSIFEHQCIVMLIRQYVPILECLVQTQVAWFETRLKT